MESQPVDPQTALNTIENPPSAQAGNTPLQSSLDSIRLLTASPVSFFHLVDVSQQTVSLQGCSPHASAQRYAWLNSEPHLRLDQAGVWADCYRLRQPIIDNSPSPSSSFKRLLSVPVFRGALFAGIIGVADSDADYTQRDADVLTGLGAGLLEAVVEKNRATYFQSLVDITNDWETLVDEQNVFRYCSTNCEKITGYTCEDFERSPDLYLRMVHPDDRPAVEAHFLEMHIDHSPSYLVFRVKTKTGEERWIELSCRAFFDTNGVYIGRRGSNRDVTERKQLELALQKKEEFLERSQRIAHLGNYEVDLQSNQIHLSQECYRILGLSEDHPVPLFTDKSKILHPEDEERVTIQMAGSIFAASEYDITFRIIRPNGEIRYVQNIGKPVKNDAGEVCGIFGTIQDITEKKTIENSLLESETRFRSVLDNASSMAVQGYAPDGTVQYWNQASERIYGYTEEEALGKNLLDLIIPPEMRKDVEGAIQQMFSTGEPLDSAELDLMHKDGSRVAVYSSHAIVKRQNHEPELFCIDLDLSARRKMEAALRQSEERFRSLVESITDIIFSLDENGSILYVSPTWRLMFQKDDDAIGRSFIEFLHPDELPGIYTRFDQLIRTGEKIERMELRIKDKNDAWQWHSVNASISKETHNGSKVIVGIMRNISESKIAEAIRNAEVEIMNICHFASNKESLLRELVDYFKRLTGFDAVGVRLHEGKDFPYFAVQGFSDEHLRRERYLCVRNQHNQIDLGMDGEPVLDCMCGHILTGSYDPARPYYTKFGSFITNSTTNFLHSISEADQLGHTRNYCNEQGYESVGLFPLRAQGRMFGLFQFNDRRRDRFNPSMVQQLENLSDYVALALANFEATEALRESEEKYRILVENASEGICVLQNGACQFHNPKMREIFGMHSGFFAAGSFLDVIHSADKEMVSKYQLDRLAGIPAAASIQCRFTNPREEVRWMELSAAPIQWMGKPATLNFISDITERKLAQDALLNSELKLRDMIDNFDGAIWAVDRDFKLIIFNTLYQASHKKYFGHDISLGEDLSTLPHLDAETNRQWREIHGRVMRGEHLTVETKSGLPNEIEYVEASYTPIHDVSHEIIGMTVMVRDISERKRSEQERHALEEKFFNAFHTSPDSISINSMFGGVFIDINEGFTTMMGYTPEEIIGKTAADLQLWARPEDRDLLIESMKTSGELINLETPMRTKDGRILICLMSAKIIKVNGENSILSITRDISERKKAEAQLNEQIEELRRWHAVTLGRETRIIDLKNEVNDLLVKEGQPPRYIIGGDSGHV